MIIIDYTKFYIEASIKYLIKASFIRIKGHSIGQK